MMISRTLPLFIITAVCAVAAFFSVALRCYTRIRIVKLFGWDDWLMVFASAFFTWTVVDIFRNPFYAVGGSAHMSDHSTEDARLGYHLWWMNYMAYGITMTLARLSVALFFLRITVWRWHHWMIYLNIFGNVTSGLVYLGVVIFQCTPVNHFWNKVDPTAKGRCIPIDIFIDLGYLYGSVSAFCDLVLVALPLHLVWNLEVSRQTKLATAPLLSMAGLCGCCPLARMAYLQKFHDPDFFFATVDIAIWSTFEPGIAIAAASAATCRPLLKSLLLKLGFKSEPGSVKRKGFVGSLHSIVLKLAFDDASLIRDTLASQEHLHQVDTERGDIMMALRPGTPSTMNDKRTHESDSVRGIPRAAISIQEDFAINGKEHTIDIIAASRSSSATGKSYPLHPELQTYLHSVRSWGGNSRSLTPTESLPETPEPPSHEIPDASLNALPPIHHPWSPVRGKASIPPCLPR
ncbi:hypothetical protein EJ05DRAFT_142333 [Pseudovirgaria hyperparasitica]|uniref:Rhodopsin domain-containing protein n=1 Tax=Pseudovirgaria hyperparasitica TaxID=470096 RepID=A0A6A6VUV7_9PEZI|nr:uncharacterized protein EJ05DRAFT_142333 [Pseudovirgaria hyperparasitica]KAF2754468.1 hypothetical protein EJ05DRAFT_142333 [Pseudovirgaria hyperparasitica]